MQYQQQNIERVDQLVRKNNVNYLDKKNQEAYEKALSLYQKQRRRQNIKAYAEVIKEGNKKALQKRKQQQNTRLKKKAVKKIKKQQTSEIVQEFTNRKTKMSERQKQIIDKAIQSRADRHLQELQLDKLNKKLQEQKKKTKLYELNRKCQKILSKSHKNIPDIPQSIPQQRRAMLQQYKKQTQEQVQKIDDIIANLINKANSKKCVQLQKAAKVKLQNRNQNNGLWKPEIDIFDSQFQQQFYRQFYQNQEMGEQDQDICDSMMTDILFLKSADQLLKMDFIPIN